MRVLEWKDYDIAYQYILQAAQIAKKATCLRSKCWSIIVKDEIIIWTWFNSPVHDDESQRKCNNSKDIYNKKITDKTCCVHAEQRAIIDSLKNYPDKIIWSKLYFIRLWDDGKISFAGKPYCTICSKMALDCWISNFLLYTMSWIVEYDTWEYNLLSYEYNE